MNIGTLITLLKLVQDAEIAKPKRDLYAKETALYRAQQGLGL